MSFRVSLVSVMRKIASYLTKNRSETGRKIAQSTHENEYIKQEKTFCRNSKQFLNSYVVGHRQKYAVFESPYGLADSEIRISCCAGFGNPSQRQK